jgi:hypothetical protein
MDAPNPPNYCVTRPVECGNRGKREEEVMINESLPLPAALRNDELSEQEFDALYRNAVDPNSTKGRLKRIPRAIPVQEREPVNS